MDPVFAACQSLGIGIAVGAMAGAAGLEGGPRRTIVILAAAAGLLLGVLSATADDESVLAGALAGLFGGALACTVTGDVVAGARRRTGEGGALGPIVALVALAVAGASILLPPLALVAALGLLWLAAARRRRSQRKFEGLRILR